MEIDKTQSLEDIMNLSPEERKQQFRADEKIITEALHDFSNKYKGYVVGISIMKFSETYEWSIHANMNSKLLTDTSPSYHGDK